MRYDCFEVRALSPDQALAERLKAALERKDTDARVFFAPSSLRAGGFWSRTLAEEIAQAAAFILLVGEKGVGDWQVLEYDEALDKRVKFPDFPLILVLLEGQTAPGLPFLRRRPKGLLRRTVEFAVEVISSSI